MSRAVVARPVRPTVDTYRSAQSAGPADGTTVPRDRGPVALVRVLVEAQDALDEAGVVRSLRRQPGFTLLTRQERDSADVLIVACDRLTDTVIATLHDWTAEIGAPVLLVAGEVSDSDVLTLLECQVVAVLPRLSATAERLTQGVLTAVSGSRSIHQPKLVGQLFRDLERMTRIAPEPADPPTDLLSSDDLRVLRMLADGLDTAEIADQLHCTVRTVKGQISRITRRLDVRNRCAAVAYAVRSDLLS